jgi:energy-converting hydrogenase Eha subunit H
VFALLGAVHVFWALGGRLGFVSAVPEVNGQRAFTPTPAATFAVALALFVASALVLGRAGVFSSLVPAALFKWPLIVMGLVFLVRAVGEFKLVGLFKRVRGTSFARWDTWLFSPLCLGISLAALWLAFL